MEALIIMKGMPTTVYTTHGLHVLHTISSFAITNARETSYELLLNTPELMLERCNSVNPAGYMMTPSEVPLMTALRVQNHF